MSKKAGEIAALEQRLLVAVLQGDDHARRVARAEIARLKRQAPPAQQPDASGSPHSATASRAAVR